MALRQLASPLRIFAVGWISPWRYKVRMGLAATSVPTARVCVNISPDQGYSRRNVYSEDELASRSKFLAAQFQGSESEMHHFLASNQQLVTMGKDKFYRLTELLAQHGIGKKEVLIYPNVYRRKYETVAGRIRQLEDGGIKPVTLRMINTTHKKYRTKLGRLIIDAEASEMFQSSMGLLSATLGMSEEEADVILNESVWLHNTKLSTLREKIKLLWDLGVSSEAIRERIWVLAFPTSTIKSRLEALRQSGIHFKDFPKQYLIAVKSSDDKFKKFLERLLEDSAILRESGCSDKAAYICFRLSCSEENLQAMSKKFSALLSIRLPKLQSNLDLLLKEYGVAPSLIVDFPRVLRLSAETTRDRLRQLQELGVPVSGRIFNMTNRDYELFISKLGITA